MKYLNKKNILIGASLLLLGILVLWKSFSPTPLGETTKPSRTLAPTAVVLPTLPSLPEQKTLPNSYHIYQSFNNCGPAALSMALSYYDIHVSQEELGKALRPYQVANGDNDDKSVTLDELGAKAHEYGLTPYHRPMGSIMTLKQFIALDIPVLTRTWTHANEDIGHYRVVKGYDDTRQILIQDDSLQGKNLEYSYTDFNELWEKFNFEYLVLVPKDKLEQAQQIIGKDVQEKIAWSKSIENSKKQLLTNPENIYARFNLSVAYYHTGQFEQSISEYEKIENALPFRTLWYQTEPLDAYFALGNYQKVFELTDKILQNQNRAYSELYVLRGKSYQKLGQTDLAEQEFTKAIMYNSSLKRSDFPS